MNQETHTAAVSEKPFRLFEALMTPPLWVLMVAIGALRSNRAGWAEAVGKAMSTFEDSSRFPETEQRRCWTRAYDLPLEVAR